MKKRKRKAPSIGKVAKKTVSNLSKKAFDRMYPRSKSDKQKTNAAGEKSGGGFYGEGLNAPVGYAEGFGDVQLPKPKQPRIKGKKRGKYKARGGSILRAGKTALKGGNRALARFIAARYSPKAIAKYQDYAGRLRRSKRLIKQIVKIDDATYRIKGHIIKTDTAGNNPYSCTCPDFSQFSIDARNWLGSKAGPFNPCKHMMAVRDREINDGKWACSGGNCIKQNGGPYGTKAECEAARINQLVTGGNCRNVFYQGFVDWVLKAGGIFLEEYPEGIPIYQNIFSGGTFKNIDRAEIFIKNDDIGSTRAGIYIRVYAEYPSPPEGYYEFKVTAPPYMESQVKGIYFYRFDRLPECGDLPKYCP